MKLVVKNIQMTYENLDRKNHSVLNDISFEICQNEFVAIVGSSGCGKSTLLNIIGGLIPQTNGEVYFEGKNFNNTPRISMVFQDSALFPWKNVYNNVIFGIKNYTNDLEYIQKQGNHYIKMVGLEQFKAYYPKHLSGGMKQRVGIARALAIKPDLLIMDEPFSALDAPTRLILQEQLLNIWEEQPLSTLYVTHNVDEAVYLADKVIILSKKTGTIKTILPILLPKSGRKSVNYKKEFDEYVNTILQFIFEDSKDDTQKI
ncbi:ABC transporter ATP-binding protein [Bacillus sp. 196mf]|uniref:ABC transporter ATP-binding protein n=1 Tax=Bacillus sp. 196mf TaxID=1761754 RepID=UPI000D9C03AB|nr:ABC transporter ATP-binding protein [Bacillus sp. 196mf]PYE88351.1 NitT/TauT family transport system ATP-binding protein [Bacillus sp. 196mf]